MSRVDFNNLHLAVAFPRERCSAPKTAKGIAKHTNVSATNLPMPRALFGNLGKSTVEYVGVQAEEPPQLTLWTVRMYGGLVLSDDRQKRDGEMQSCSMWWIITGPPEVNERFDRLKRPT